MKTNPVSGDRFVAGFAHQVTADADDEVEAFNTRAECCKDQAQDDGHQQETLGASIASTNAAIEKFTAKAESALREKRRRASANLRLSFWSLWILSNVRSRFFQNEMAKNPAFLQNLNNVAAALHCGSRCGSFFLVSTNRSWWRSFRARNQSTMKTVSCLLPWSQLVKATALTLLSVKGQLQP